MPQLFMSCMDRWGIFVRLPTLLGSPSIPCFLFEKHMSLKIQGGIVNINEYHDNSTEYYIDARGKDLAFVMRALETEDITPSEDSSFASDNLSDISDSIIFTKKAKKEGKEAFILQALQKSVQGRKDKTRAFVQELQSWQNDGYVDAHYNARVMYDELEKLMSLPFGEEVFRKHYNNTRA